MHREDNKGFFYLYRGDREIYTFGRMKYPQGKTTVL